MDAPAPLAVSEATHSGVTVRDATIDDAARLAAFGARTFAATYEHANDPAETAAHLARTFGDEKQRAEIEDPSRHMLVVDVDGALGAYALLHHGALCPVEWTSGPQVELERIYVDGVWQGRGLADALMDAILEKAAGAGAESIWLSVWEENPRAIRFYERRGFREIGATVFVYGNEPQTDKVLVRAVRERRTPVLGVPVKVARPQLTVRLQRGREGRDLLVCVRADGTTSWIRRPKGLPRRDRALLALEAAVPLSDGVFARVAEGAELLELLRPENATAQDGLGWSLRFAALLDAEQASPGKATLAMVQAALDDRHESATPPVALDDAMLLEVRASVARLETTWRRVAAGEALEFTVAPGQPGGLSAPVRRKATQVP